MNGSQCHIYRSPHKIYILVVDCADSQQTRNTNGSITIYTGHLTISTSWLLIVLTTSKQETRMAPNAIYTGHLTRSTSWLLIVLTTSKQETRMAPNAIYTGHLTRSTSWLLIVLTASKQEIRMAPLPYIQVTSQYLHPGC